MERLFLASENVYPEHKDKIHERWTYILTHLPLVRGRHLLDDMTDVFEFAMGSVHSDVVTAGYDLAQLRYRFVLLLYEGRMIPTHMVNIFHAEQQRWLGAIYQKIIHTEPYGRKGHRLRKPRELDYTLTWMN